MILPETADKLASWAMDIVEQCRVSATSRSSMARNFKQWKYTGSPDGNVAIYNKLGPHLDRLASYLFSPSNLRFFIQFENSYPANILAQAQTAARVLSREFSRRNFDMRFSEGVGAALDYGLCLTKMAWGHDGPNMRLVMPWQFGVYREDMNSLADQEAMVETNYITKHDLWRLVGHLKDGEKLFKRATTYAKKATSQDAAEPYFHSLLISGTPPVVQTDPPYMAQPGGLIQVTADPSGGVIAPEIAVDLLPFHELWVRDTVRDDYTVIQIVEPDIVIAGRMRRANLFVPGEVPYNMIQPNNLLGHFWGRSEIADLMQPQRMLRDRMEDIKKLMSLQYDRYLAFLGMSGMTDELYDQSRQAGYITNNDPGAKIQDLTPPMPANAFEDVEFIIKIFDDVAGFNNILGGQGEPGVRAGVHANTLLKTASPRLRDRALICERQCSDVAHKLLKLMATKEARAYWSDRGMDPMHDFLLDQLPDDAMVEVDSHSASPIYEEDHKELVFNLAKLGWIGADQGIDLLPVPNPDAVKAAAAEMAEKKAAQLEDLKKNAPAEYYKVIAGGKK
jgi:hypothetical protein